MSDTNHEEDECDAAGRTAKPSLAQVKIIVEFIKKHPQLNTWKLKDGNCNQKSKKLWSELSNSLNAIDGAVKSNKGWIKFWADKKHNVQIKNRHIQQGKTDEVLCPLEQQILEMCDSKGKRKVVKEPINVDEYNDNSEDALFSQEDDLKLSSLRTIDLSPVMLGNEERYTNIMERIVDAMDQQATAIAKIAQASLDNARALERVSEAAHLQAMAIERLSHKFVDVTTSVQDVRTSMMNIDYTIKRIYPVTTNNQRHNSNFFS